jgi:hypothetical protein
MPSPVILSASRYLPTKGTTRSTVPYRIPALLRVVVNTSFTHSFPRSTSFRSAGSICCHPESAITLQMKFR